MGARKPPCGAGADRKCRPPRTDWMPNDFCFVSPADVFGGLSNTKLARYFIFWVYRRSCLYVDSVANGAQPQSKLVKSDVYAVWWIRRWIFRRRIYSKR